MQPNIAILMGTLNGEKYLEEQLRSIGNQTYQNWKLFISDDSSSDATISIIQNFSSRHPNGKVTLFKGPSEGFAKNFMSLASNPDIRADLYFFSDQDDIWLPGKLQAAIDHFSIDKQKGPSLYGARTLLGRINGSVYGISPLFRFPKIFRNALVQSVAGGNTMAFNHALKILVEEIGDIDIVSHDWWFYILVTGIGGKFFYDETPNIIYRQHPQSVVGANTSILNKLSRIKYVLSGRYKKWNEINTIALTKVRHLLADEHLEDLSYFIGARNATSVKDRVRLLNIAGVYRQNREGTLALFLAILLNKI